MAKNNDSSRHALAVKYAINDILQGGTYSVIVNKLMNDDYDLKYNYSKRQSENILYEARDVIKKDFEEQLPTLREDAIARLLDIYTEAREMGDRQSALKSIEQMSKMFGLNQDKVKVEADINQVIQIDFGYDKEN